MWCIQFYLITCFSIGGIDIIDTICYAITRRENPRLKLWDDVMETEEFETRSENSEEVSLQGYPSVSSTMVFSQSDI